MTDDELLEKAILVAQRKIAERDKIIAQKQERIEQMKPKEVFADSVSASRQSILIGDLAKLICQNGHSIGQKRMFQWMRDNGYLMKTGSSYNMPIFDDAVEYVKNWKLCNNTRMLIEEHNAQMVF